MNHITIDTLRIFSVQSLIALGLLICRMSSRISRLPSVLMTLSRFLIQCPTVLKTGTYIKAHFASWQEDVG